MPWLQRLLALQKPLREVKYIDNTKVYSAFDVPYLDPSVAWAHQCVMPSLTFFQEEGVVMPKVLGTQVSVASPRMTKAPYTEPHRSLRQLHGTRAIF